jgi:uncharacterized protein YacL
MTTIPEYSKSEKDIFFTASAITILSLIVLFISENSYMQIASLIAIILSVSEILFIAIYRDIVYNSDEKFNHKTTIIGIIKLFSLVIGCITSALLIFILTLLIELIKIITPILWILITIFLVFAFLVLINKKIVQNLYKPPQK